jgi:hypothetical protein
MIDSEMIKYSGKAGNTLTGVTRAATFTQWTDGASRSFTSSSAAPLRQHWCYSGVKHMYATGQPLGFSGIMDGQFDADEGYQFTFNRTNYGLPGVIGQKQTVFVMRLES